MTSGWLSGAGDCLRAAAGVERNLGSRSSHGRSHGREVRSGHWRSRRQGKITAIGLAVLGAGVGITGRDPARAQAAAEGIRAASAVTSRGRSPSAAMASGRGVAAALPAGTHLTGLSPTA